MATLADFKRKCIVGAKIRGGYYWKTPKAETTLEECEWRVIDKVQSNAIRINGSYMDFPKAKDSDFDGRVLTIYETGWRKLTDEEKAVLEEWENYTKTDTEYQKRAEMDALTDTNMTFYEEKEFFVSRGMEHLFWATPTKELCKWKMNNGEEYCVKDSKAEHGKAIAKYEIE